MTRTRSYPIPPHTPLMASIQNALSMLPELGAPAMGALLTALRPRIMRLVTPLYGGLRRPTLSLDEYTDHALMAVAAQLETCPMTSDDAVYTWVSIVTTGSLLETYSALGVAPSRPAALSAAADQEQAA
jgi:hypothetical protein